jgi:hypothetical protein
VGATGDSSASTSAPKSYKLSENCQETFLSSKQLLPVDKNMF